MDVIQVPSNVAHRRQRRVERTAKQLIRTHRHNLFLYLFLLIFCIDYGHALPIRQLFGHYLQYTNPQINTKHDPFVHNSISLSKLGSNTDTTASFGSDKSPKNGLITFQPTLQKRYDNFTSNSTTGRSLCFIQMVYPGTYIDHSDVLNPVIHDGSAVIDGVVLNHVQSYRNGWLLFCPRGQPIMAPGFEAEANQTKMSCRPYYGPTTLHGNDIYGIEGTYWTNSTPIVFNNSINATSINGSWTGYRVGVSPYKWLANSTTPPYPYANRTSNVGSILPANIFLTGSNKNSSASIRPPPVRISVTAGGLPKISSLPYWPNSTKSVATVHYTYYPANSTRFNVPTASSGGFGPSSKVNITIAATGRKYASALITPAPTLYQVKNGSASTNRTFASGGLGVGLLAWKSTQSSPTPVVKAFPGTNSTTAATTFITTSSATAENRSSSNSHTSSVQALLQSGTGSLSSAFPSNSSTASYASMASQSKTIATAMAEYTGTPIYSMEPPSSTTWSALPPITTSNLTYTPTHEDGPDIRRQLYYWTPGLSVFISVVFLTAVYLSRRIKPTVRPGVDFPDVPTGQTLYRFRYQGWGNRLEQFLDMVESTKVNGVNVRVSPLLPDEEVVILPGGQLEVQPGSTVALPEEAVVRLSKTTVLLAEADGLLYLCKAMTCEPGETGTEGIPFKKGIPTRIPVNERPGEIEEFREIKIRSYGLGPNPKPAPRLDIMNQFETQGLQWDMRVRFEDGSFGPQSKINYRGPYEQQQSHIRVRFPGMANEKPNAWKGRFWTTPTVMSHTAFANSVPPGLEQFAAMYQGMVKNPDWKKLDELGLKKMMETNVRPWMNDGRTYALISGKAIPCKFENGQYVLTPDYDDSYGPRRASELDVALGGSYWKGGDITKDWRGPEIIDSHPRPSPPPHQVPANRPRPPTEDEILQTLPEDDPLAVSPTPTIQSRPQMTHAKQPPVNQPSPGSGVPAKPKLPGPDNHWLWLDSEGQPMENMKPLFRDPHFEYQDPYPANMYDPNYVPSLQADTQPSPQQGNAEVPPQANTQALPQGNSQASTEGNSPAESLKDDILGLENDYGYDDGDPLDPKTQPAESPGPVVTNRAEVLPTGTNLMRWGCAHPWYFFLFIFPGIFDCLGLLDTPVDPPGVLPSVVNPEVIKYYKDHSIPIPTLTPLSTLYIPVPTPTPTPAAPTYDEHAKPPPVLHVSPEVAAHYQRDHPNAYAYPPDPPLPTSWPKGSVIIFRPWNNTMDGSVLPDLPDPLLQEPQTVTEFYSQLDNWSLQAQQQEDACNNDTACLSNLQKTYTNAAQWNTTTTQQQKSKEAKTSLMSALRKQLAACNANITCVEEMFAPIITNNPTITNIKKALAEQDAKIAAFRAHATESAAPAQASAYKQTQEMIDEATKANEPSPPSSGIMVTNEAAVDPEAAQVVHLDQPGQAEAVGDIADTMMLGILGGLGEYC